MNPLLGEIRYTPMLWMLIFVPAVLIAARIVPAAHTLLFVLAVFAIVPLAALLSHATKAVSEKTGDAMGGLLNATLGNLTELIIAVTALHTHMIGESPKLYFMHFWGADDATSLARALRSALAHTRAKKS